MNKKNKKWLTRLAAGAMALLLAAGTAATDLTVYAADQSAQESSVSVRKITGFAELPEKQKTIRLTGKIGLKRLLEKMPQSIEVYLDGETGKTSIPVTWSCVGDYDNSDYFTYQFKPKWDTDVYKLGSGLKGKSPYVAVFILGNGRYKGAAISTEQRNANEKAIYNFMKDDMGLNTAAACGVLANIQSESSFNPTASILDTNNKTSYGICQWNGSRFDALRSYCSENGYEYSSLEGQLNYLKYELEHSESSAFAKVKNVENTADGAYTAGYNWARYFERCASTYFDWRATLARDTYWAKYGEGSSEPDDTSKAYTITYILYDGENNDDNPETYKTTTATITLKDPKKKGYTFAGWYKEEKLKTQVKTIPKGSKGNITLYAKWTAHKYTIQFYGNKANSGSMGEMSNLEYDTTYKLQKNKFARTGYKFDHWSTKADGSGKSYDNKEEIENLSAKDGKIIKLYAQWSRKNYKITYKTNGGELADGTKTKYNVDTKTFKLKDPVKEGYTFQGWYTNKKLTERATQVNKDSTGNRTFYAKWKVNWYKIQYNGNGATSGSMKNPAAMKYGKTYTLAKNKFKRTGYVFEGWNTKANGKGDFYENREDIRNVTIKDGKTVTLYAQWSKKAYSIKYYLDGGMIPEDSAGSYYFDTPTFTLAPASRDGYTFEGWYTDAAFTNKITKIKKGARKNYKLYAKWKLNTYNIAFDGNGATGGVMTGMNSCNCHQNYTLPVNTYERAGYRFIGWSTTADGSDTFYGDGATVSNLSLTNGATVTLYAQWEALAAVK